MATLGVPVSGGASLGFARRAMDEAIDRSERQAFGKHLRLTYPGQDRRYGGQGGCYGTPDLPLCLGKGCPRYSGHKRSSMAKLYGTEAAQEVTDQAVQIFGGMGGVSGVPVERLYREIRALRIYEGTSEIQKLVIAGQALAASAG